MGNSSKKLSNQNNSPSFDPKKATDEYKQQSSVFVSNDTVNVKFNQNSFIQQLFKRRDVYINDGKWEQFQMNKICQKIKIWNVFKLFISSSYKYLDSNPNAIEIIRIVHIKFPELRTIDLSNCLLQSIEALSHAQMPLLSMFYLSKAGKMQIPIELIKQQIWQRGIGQTQPDYLWKTIILWKEAQSQKFTQSVFLRCILKWMKKGKCNVLNFGGLQSQRQRTFVTFDSIITKDQGIQILSEEDILYSIIIDLFMLLTKKRIIMQNILRVKPQTSDIEPLLLRLLQKSQVVLINQKWRKASLSEVCSGIIQWNIHKLSAFGNNQSQIIHDISEIQFNSLQCLLLERNNIESVEQLNRLYLPALEKLGIDNNKICNIETMRKGRWPQLRKLDLSQNKIRETKPLKSLSPVQIKQLIIEQNCGQKQGTDIRWIFVWKNKQIEKIYVESNERVKQPQLKIALQKRNKKIEMKFK